MKKFLLGIILPVLTLVTLIGTGFATWYFGATSAINSSNIGITVEAFEAVGKWEIKQPTKATLVLDQPKGPAQNITLKDTQPASAAVNSITGTYTGVEGAANKELTVTCTITIPANLAKYIELDSTKFGTAKIVGTDEVYTVDMKTANTLTIDSSSFKYATTQGTKVGEPKTVEAYKQMITDTTDVNITVKFEAKITPAA